jgi:transposase-like protein
MELISFDRHRFPPEIIRYAVWLYAKFTLSFRDVEDLPAERSLQRFKSPGPAQRFLNLQSATYNGFYFQRNLLDRTTFKRYREGALND